MFSQIFENRLVLAKQIETGLDEARDRYYEARNRVLHDQEYEGEVAVLYASIAKEYSEDGMIGYDEMCEIANRLNRDGHRDCMLYLISSRVSR